MRNTLTVFKRETRAFFVTPLAYLVITAFVFMAAFFFFNYLGNFNKTLAENQLAARVSAGQVKLSGRLNLNEWVLEVYYHTLIFMLVFMMPLLAMRAFAEERRRGTLELLLSAPIRAGEVVWGKYLALVLVTVLMLGLSFAFPLLLWLLGDPGPEVPPMLSGAAGVLLCGAAFGALAMAGAVFGATQAAAAACSLTVLLLLYVVFWPARSLSGYGQELLKGIAPVWQANFFIEGVVTLSGCVYFLSLIALGLFVCRTMLELRRWR
jgi:ABC-2 type transport system permease protein